MRKQQNIRDLLGLTQEELAMLLGVTRSQLAKYELGLGDLSVPAKLLLADMLTHFNDPEASAKHLPHQEQQHIQKERQLERLLKENEYQQLLVAKKISATEKRYTAKVKALRLVDYLNNRPDNKKENEQLILKTIANSANKVLEKDGYVVLLQYRLKHELLVLEKMLLEAELRKQVSTP